VEPRGTDASIWRPFAELLLRHQREGTGRDAWLDQMGYKGVRGRKWDPKEFAQACGITERAERYWRSGEKLPDDTNIIESVLFGDTEARSDRLELREAFDRDRWQRRQSGTYLRADLSSSEAEPKLEGLEPPAVAVQWEIADQENIGLGLAYLLVHKPPSSNWADTFLLQVSLSMTQWADEIGNFGVRFGLRAAHLMPAYTNCQPAQLGEVDHIEERGGMFAVTGPRADPSDLLDGKPLIHTTLATMERTNDAPAEVKMSLRSRKRDLDVVPEDPNLDISPTKEAMLRTFLQECQIEDESRFVTWGCCTLKQKTIV
jgi:hypothetical protein